MACENEEGFFSSFSAAEEEDNFFSLPSKIYYNPSDSLEVNNQYSRSTDLYDAAQDNPSCKKVQTFLHGGGKIIIFLGGGGRRFFLLLR